MGNMNLNFPEVLFAASFEHMGDDFASVGKVTILGKRINSEHIISPF